MYRRQEPGRIVRMSPLGAAAIAVLLPGTGSDAGFAHAAFAPALAAHDIAITAVEPDPRAVVAGYLAALDAAADRHGRVLAAGISIGAAVALRWAAQRPDRAAGVLAALPAWTGDPADAPAAHSARLTADRLRADGLDTVLAAMRANSPGWLADTLTRSWTAQWPDLPRALDEAAGYRAPGAGELARITVPCGLAAAEDDPVHPVGVAEEWVQTLPHAELERIRLADIGADPAVLGRACLTALGRVRQPR